MRATLDAARQRIAADPVVVTLDGDRWTLHADWIVHLDDCSVRIPKGYSTDFASIPRFLYPIRTSTELTLEAPLLHDFLYQTAGEPQTAFPPRTFTRADADRVFYELMRHEGAVARRHAWAAWLAVRSFGWLYWGDGG